MRDRLTGIDDRYDLDPSPWRMWERGDQMAAYALPDAHRAADRSGPCIMALVLRHLFGCETDDTPPTEDIRQALRPYYVELERYDVALEYARIQTIVEANDAGRHDEARELLYDLLYFYRVPRIPCVGWSPAESRHTLGQYLTELWSVALPDVPVRRADRRRSRTTVG